LSQPNDPKTPTPAKPVFFDPTSHRFAVLSVLLAAFIILVMVWAFLFSQGLYNSRLPDRPDSGTVVSPLLFDKPAGEMVQDLSQPSQAVSTVAAPESDWSAPPVEVLAYAPAWSRDAFRSVRENITSIDVLLPEWYGIDQSEAGLVSLSADHEQEFREFVALNQGALKLIPVVRTDVAGSGLPPAMRMLCTVSIRSSRKSSGSLSRSPSVSSNRLISIWARPSSTNAVTFML